MKVGHMAMHACRVGPTDTAHHPRFRLTELAMGKGEHFEAGNLLAPISPLLTQWCDYTLPFESMV